MRRMIYISGKYTDRDQAAVDLNIARAKTVGLAVRAAGFVPVVPHIAVVPCPTLSYNDAMAECMEFLGMCDGILMMEGWDQSKGACMEYNQAIEWEMPVFFSIQQLVDGMEAVA